MEEKAYTVNEIAKIFRREASTVRRWIREGRLVAYGNAHDLVVFESDLISFKEAYRYEPPKRKKQGLRAVV